MNLLCPYDVRSTAFGGGGSAFLLLTKKMAKKFCLGAAADARTALCANWTKFWMNWK